MSFNLDDAVVGGQLKVGSGIAPATGEGPLKINGSAMLEGPVVSGQPTHFPTPYATLNIGPLTNSDSPPAFAPGALPLGLSNPYSAMVSPNLGVMGNLDVNFRIQAGGTVSGLSVFDYKGNVLAAKKDFDIPHPTKDGWRLRHVAPEAPSADVYVRGRVTNKKEIDLPNYWKGLVDWTTITVNLTPVGSHQDIIVKRFDEEKIYLQSNGGLPVDCFYHIYAERKDCERNISEYEGASPEDYPGDNSQYLQSGKV
tara:strand:+ start:1643 stop:2404 length:762 start_codon:yes stop_codon:yes gene_type:complete